MKLTLTVNGERHEVDVPPNTTLLSVLRDDLELTGTRYGCGRGQCGACYVVADNRAVASCLLTADQATRMEITTVEGLARGAELNPVQQAFIAEDAAQCGYCTNGMMMAATVFLRQHRHPSEEQIKAALAPWLCRCGTHYRIVRAVQRAARAMA